MDENYKENENQDQGQDQSGALISEPDENGVRYYRGGNAGDGARAAQGKKKKEKSSNKTLRNNLIILGCIVLGFIILGVACEHMLYGESSEIRLPSGPYIATVYVEGTIQQGSADMWGNAVGYQHQWTLDKIDSLIADHNNKGLVVFVNSPGGGVYESDELYFKLKEYQEITGNPVYSAMGSMAASGGYYISAPADKIIANRNCLTGSIGVTIGTLIDFSEFLNSYGIKTVTITSGENKAMGSNFEPLTAEQMAIFQSLVDDSYEQFVGVVAEGRGMELELVKELADGRLYTASQALDAGLIDGIGTLEDAVWDMKETYELYGCEVVDIYIVNNSFIANLLGTVDLNTLGGKSEAEALMEFLENQNQFSISYLCEVLM